MHKKCITTVFLFSMLLQSCGKGPALPSGETIRKKEVKKGEASLTPESLANLQEQCKQGHAQDLSRGKKETQLHREISAGCTVDTVESLLNTEKIDIEAKDQYGFTPLHLAVLRGHLPTVVSLLKRGANIESKDSEHCTPLHFAVEEKRIDIVKQLLAGGANGRAKNSDGFTPLHYAALSGHAGIMEILSDHILNNNKIIDEFTLLHLAAQQGHAAIVKLLLEKGAAIDAKDASGYTPLHCAAKAPKEEEEEEEEEEATKKEEKVQADYEATVRLLLKKGANKEAADPSGFTPLCWAVQEKNTEIEKLLREQGANTAILDRHNQRTSLLHALQVSRAKAQREAELQKPRHKPE